MYDVLRRMIVVCLVSQACLGCHWLFPYDSGSEDVRADGSLDRPMFDARREVATSDTGPIVPTLMAISVGSAHTCAIKVGGDLYCWGWNEWGQLGLGDTNVASLATPRKVLANVTTVSAGVNHTCAVSDNQLYCWGYNGSGHLGTGVKSSTESKPLAVKLDNVEEVGTGNFHTCARTAEGAVWCWGTNGYGEVGLGKTSEDILKPTKVGVCTAKQIAVGLYHSCALCEAGTVFCWGQNEVGQVGNGTTQEKPAPDQVYLVGGEALVDVVAIRAGAQSTCVVRKDRTAACWGLNSHGQVDSAVTSNRMRAAPLSLANVVEIAPGERHTCATVGADRHVVCWGSNLIGQLGDGKTADTTAPQPVAPPVVDVVQLASMSRTTCALLPTRIACWGSFSRGQIGDGRDGNQLTPVQVTLPSAAVAVDLDAGERHTCAVLKGGDVYCWGDNTSGQGGVNGNNYALAQPTPVQKSKDITAPAVSVSAGIAHSCMIMNTHQAACWGENGSGQLGDGTVTSRFTAAFVLSASNKCNLGGPIDAVDAVGAGVAHTCLRSTSNAVYCTGSNRDGQVGIEMSTTSVSCPTQVSDVASKVISVGDTTSCVLTGLNLACWGTVLGSSDVKPTPETVVGTSSEGSLSAGRTHGCFVSADKNALCWGTGGNGQLGNNATATLLVPATADAVKNGSSKTLADVVSVSASHGWGWTGAHSCAATGSGVYCWGWNGFGQLGNGNRTSQKHAGAPLTTAKGTPITATKVTTGAHHSCALDKDGHIWCWGYNGGGAVGMGTLPAARMPVIVTP
jgi:alpha-tubulin suppressor-like RCC1 family protein